MSDLNSSLHHNRPSTLARWFGTPLLNPLNDLQALRGLLGAINPMWALGEVRARVVAMQDESADVRSFVLQPNRAWRGYRAGQHVLVELEINGVRRQRSFSISSTPGKRRAPLVLSIKRHAAGGVTDWMHQNLRLGSVLKLSQALGEFAVPSAAKEGLVLLSAGSGITPVLSLLRKQLQHGFDGTVHFIHICRTPADALFEQELQALVGTHPNLQLQRWISGDRGRFEVNTLLQLVPKATELTTLMCGPTALMQEVRDHYSRDGALARLHFEDFNGAMQQRARGDGHTHAVSGPGTRQSFVAESGLPLLHAAEAAGLKPAYGCRIGICMTCQCAKLSGTVENLRTGAVSSQPGERIQLCISAARSDVVLAP